MLPAKSVALRRTAAILPLTLMALCVCLPGYKVKNRPIECRLFPEWEAATCQQMSDGSVVVSQRSLAQLSFGPEGLSSIIIWDKGLYFVNRYGKTAPAFVFDNGPDDVVEGLARSTKDHKIGFVNTKLDVIIAPVWDFAYPFENGVAVVCTGCVEPERNTYEHAMPVGGKWGYIDRSGRTVVPVIYDWGQLPSVEAVARQASTRR